MKDSKEYFNLTSRKNGQAPEVRLSSGYAMPIVGLGTWSLSGNRCVDAVKSAIHVGYRKIDTAHMYGNEEEVGREVRESGIPREDIFVATKLYPDQYVQPARAIDEALRKLDLGYIDMLMLHHPSSDDVDVYKVMEKYVRNGDIRSLGLSCYYIKEIDRFLPQVDIKPVVVQNEIHPYYQDTNVVRHLHELGLVVEAWYPLGGRGHNSRMLNEPVLKKLAAKYNKSVQQVILRWNLQRGVAVIPGSSNPEHQNANLSLFDFMLNDVEMDDIASINKEEKHDWY